MEDLDKTKKIRHIVCSGGGITGFAFYGILREANKAGIWNLDDIETFYGTSVGSVLSVMLSLNYDWETMDDFLIKRPWNNVFSFNMYSVVEAMNRRGIFTIKNIEDTFLPLFNGKDISINITMKEFYELNKKEIHIFTTEINTMEIIDISYKTHPDWRLMDAVYASSALPFIFTPLLRDEYCFCDGGFLLNYPLRVCFEHGHDPDEIIGVNRTSTFNSETDGSLNTVPKNSITESSTLLDYIMVIFRKIMKMVLTQEMLKIKHEYTVYSLPLSLDSMYHTSISIEERIRLVKMGSDIIIHP
jgi:NTE family protein